MTLLVLTSCSVSPFIGLTKIAAEDHKSASNPVLQAPPQMARIAKGMVSTTTTILAVKGAIAGAKIRTDSIREQVPPYRKNE